MNARLHLHALTAADLPGIADWLPAGAERDLPVDDGEAWLGVRAADGPLRAVLRLKRAIGLVLPRPWYHVGCVVHAAPALGLFHRLHTLQLGHDHTGASELADVAWDRTLALAVQASALQALVNGALGMVRTQPQAYAARLIVELPGLRDATGVSPFWHGLGRHFYGGDPRAAAERLGPAWRSHVAALLPRQPVYTAFLPPAARDAIAQVDPPARVLMEVLWQAGFRYGHHVTVDDGGPVFELALD